MTHWASVRQSADEHHVSGGITRRRFLKMGATGGAIILGGIAFPSLITPAKGAEKTIKIGMYSSPRTEVVKATIIKRLEEKHRVKFLIDEGWTTDQLARLRATRQNPVHSVMWMDDIGVNIAR
jgi:putative spermidine/putrescine transport system substrate-binding protein